MKKIIVSTLLYLISASLFAGMTCREDYFGNTTCTGTGNDAGYDYNIRKDYFDNHHYYDNKGNTMTCRTDFFGNYNCN